MADASAKRKNSKAAKAAQGVEDGAGEETEAEQEVDAAVDLPEEIEDYFYAFYAALDGMEASDLPLAEQRRYKGPG